LSQDHGGQLVRYNPPKRPGRPSLDRPSLFAGMDNQDSVLDDDMQRVRILSTLESARRPLRSAPSRKRRSDKLGKGWQAKALMTLMGAGILALLASFAIIVTEGHVSNSKVDEAMQSQVLGTAAKVAATSAASAARATTTTDAHGTAPDAAQNNPLAALIAPTGKGAVKASGDAADQAKAAPTPSPAGLQAQVPDKVPAPTPQTAVIETVASPAPTTPTPTPTALANTNTNNTPPAVPKQALGKPANTARTPTLVLDQVPTGGPATASGMPTGTPTATAKVPSPLAQPTKVAAQPVQPLQPAQTGAKPNLPAQAPVSTAALAKAGAATASSTATLVAASASKPAPARNSPRTTGSRRDDDDVALLEAMFAHSGNNRRPAQTGQAAQTTPAAPAALPVAEQLKQKCGSLNGADAATCRARICVQNPSASVCHQE
jgi:hypothetical protein